MVASHIWQVQNDWEYCTLNGCKIVNNTIELDHLRVEDETFVGTIISDIRDSTFRLNHYDEIIPVIMIPVGTEVTTYVRTGNYKDYIDPNIITYTETINGNGTDTIILTMNPINEIISVIGSTGGSFTVSSYDSYSDQVILNKNTVEDETITVIYEYLEFVVWTDWMPVTLTSPMIEYTLSVNNDKVIAEYDIDALDNIYFSSDPNFFKLARMVNVAFLNSLNEGNPAIELYEILWDAFTDTARVGFAKDDYDPGEGSYYSKNAGIFGNIIVLYNNLPSQCSPVVLEYSSKHFVLNGNSDRFFQWRCELSTNNSQLSPVIKSFIVNYRLNYYDELINEFPGFFRRL